MIAISFQGWFQCRLAADPDPWDEPRGVSGWTFAYPGEPDLDRIIRFQHPTAHRSHAPAIGVNVIAVRVEGRDRIKHPLIGADVHLLEGAIFEGRNGTIARSAQEPIVPFHIEIKTSAAGRPPLRLARKDELDLSNIAALRRRQPVRFETDSADVVEATKITDTRQYRRDRRALLAQELAQTNDALRRFALNARIRRIDESDRGGIQLDALHFLVGYRHQIGSAAIVEDPGSALGAVVDLQTPWTADFWMGAWDADALCGYVQGALEVPTIQQSDPVVVSFGQVHKAHTETSAEYVGKAIKAQGDPAEAAARVVAFDAAIRRLEDADTGDGILTTAQNPVASLLQSLIAQHAEETGSVQPLISGGKEAKFDTADWLGWVGSLFQWLRKIRPHRWLPPSFKFVELPKKVRLGLLADWGTGLYGAPVCAKSMDADPKGYDICMHLGDIYYSGTEREVRKRFLPLWPRRRRLMDLACNANHEMYCGGYGYFDVVLPHFKQEASCFALRNDHFALIGIDTAYADHDLGQNQPHWLRTMAGFAREGGKDRKIILFSHHQPYSLFESQGENVTEKMQDLLDAGRIHAWYWGHEHRLVVYDPHPQWGLKGRCIGHGGMPYIRDRLPGMGGDAPRFHRAATIGRVPGGHVLDGANPYVTEKPSKYGPNGYVTLEFDGPELVEHFHQPDGTVLLSQKV